MDERPKGEGWNKVIPTNTYTIHNPHGPPVSRGMHSADSKIPLTITAAEFLQVSVERKVELFHETTATVLIVLKK